MHARSLIIAAALCAGSAQAQTEGELGTLPKGRYLCELPGDAAGLASRPIQGMWFDIVNGSRYVSENGDGVYLMTGKSVVFTRGPMRGARYEWNGMRALNRIGAPGELAKLRCVRSGRGAAD